jgi:hypothetical protein
LVVLCAHLFSLTRQKTAAVISSCL